MMGKLKILVVIALIVLADTVLAHEKGKPLLIVHSTYDMSRVSVDALIRHVYGEDGVADVVGLGTNATQYFEPSASQRVKVVGFVVVPTESVVNVDLLRASPFLSQRDIWYIKPQIPYSEDTREKLHDSGSGSLTSFESIPDNGVSEAIFFMKGSKDKVHNSGAMDSSKKELPQHSKSLKDHGRMILDSKKIQHRRAALSSAENRGLPLWMHEKESNAIFDILRSTDTVLEWGSGGSTVTFPSFVSKYISIEHNKNWSRKVLLHAQLLGVDFRYIPAQLESSNRPSKTSDYFQYLHGADNMKGRIDRVLVDGRVRPQCAIHALTLLRDLKDGRIIIHDFYSSDRPYYHIILDFFDVVAAVKDTPQTLVILAPKLNSLELLKEYKWPEWW